MTSPRAACTAAARVGPKSRSGSACIHSASPSARAKRTSATTSGAAASADRAVRLRRREQPGQVPPHAPVQLRQLGGDLLVVAPERVQLEQDGEELGLVGEHLLQRQRERAEQRVGAVDAGDRRAHALHAQVAVAPHHLDEEPLLRAEVVVQQAAGHAGLARDVVERRPGRAARADRRAHRVDDPLGLLARELAPGRRRLHPHGGYPAFARLPPCTRGSSCPSPSRSSRRRCWCPRHRRRRRPRPAPRAAWSPAISGRTGRAAVEGGGRDDAHGRGRALRPGDRRGPRVGARLPHRRAGERARHGHGHGDRPVRRPRHRAARHPDGHRGRTARSTTAARSRGSPSPARTAATSRPSARSPRGGLTVTVNSGGTGLRVRLNRAVAGFASGTTVRVAEVSAEAVDGADPAATPEPTATATPEPVDPLDPDPDGDGDDARPSRRSAPRSGSRAGASSSRSTATCAAPTTSAPRARSAPTRATTASPRSAARCSPSPTAA